MGQVTITIDKREYAITCGDGQEGHIIKLSHILNEKAKQLSASVGLINENMMLAMVGLLLADELQELKAQTGNDTFLAKSLQQADTRLSESINRQIDKIQQLRQEI